RRMRRGTKQSTLSGLAVALATERRGAAMDRRASPRTCAACAVQSVFARLAVVALAALAAMRPAPAQDFPTRPVELIVPFAPGGGSDILARLISDGLGRRLRQSFVVLNQPGANTHL